MGKKIFSDKPCGNNAKELTITIDNPVQYELKHADEKWDSVSSSNKIREYEREIERKRELIAQYRKKRDGELKTLREKKEFAANNLAGANWEVSLSSEMDVVQNKYRGLIESEEKEIGHLRTQISDQVTSMNSKKKLD